MRLEQTSKVRSIKSYWKAPKNTMGKMVENQCTNYKLHEKSYGLELKVENIDKF